jgi:hypothetical protein
VRSSDSPPAAYRRTIPRVRVGALGLVCLAMGCGGGGESSQASDPDTLTRRQKDSILSTLPIPGAGAVGEALDAADKAAERARQLDTAG